VTPPSGITSRLRPPTATGWGLIAGAAILLAGLGLLLRQPPSLHLEPRVLSTVTQGSLPVNALGIGVDDFALLGKRNELVLWRLIGHEIRALWQHNFEGTTIFGTVRDLDGDGLDEIAVATEDSAGAWAVVLSRDDKVLARLGPERDSTAGPAERKPCTINPVAMLVDSVTGRGLVCAITTLSHRPRGVALYDAATWRRRWFFPMGAWPDCYTSGDLLGDGRTVLVVGATSVANGLDINGTDDGHAVVVALAAAGRRLWQTRMAEDFARVSVLAMGGQPGRPARVIAAVKSHRASNPAPCALAVLDGRTGAVLKSREFAFGLGLLRPLDEARGIFGLGCGDGVVRAFDGDLQQVAQYRAPSAIEAWGCADLAGDGRKSVVASTTTEILLLDERLRLQSRTRLDAPASQPLPLIIADAGVGRVRLLTPLGTAMLYDVHTVPPLFDPSRLATLLGAALLGGVVVSVGGRTLRRRRLPTLRESRDFLVDYRQVRHDILDEVRPFGALWNWAHEAVADTPVPLDVFERARDEFLGIGHGTLERFITRAREMRVGTECVNRMRVRLRELDALLTAPVQGSDGELALRARGVAQAMRSLSDACGEAYREVAERAPCRPDRVVGAVLAANQGAMAERGVALHMDLEAGGGMPVLFDDGELREVVAQLVTNALAAMDGVPEPELTVRVGLDPADGRHVILRIADNGPGIAPELRETVFQPGYSSREGGGFGLGHAREVARAWRGDLVIDAPPGGRGAARRLMGLVLFPFEPRRARPAARPGPPTGAPGSVA